jgi:hypothetical protein
VRNARHRLEALERASVGGFAEPPSYDFAKTMFCLWCNVRHPENHPELLRRVAELVLEWWPQLADALRGRAKALGEIPKVDEPLFEHFAEMAAPFIASHAERFAKLAAVAVIEGATWRPENESLESLFAVALADSTNPEVKA